jgi:hypothetical protein
VVEARLYINYINKRPYMYMNYFDEKANKVVHVYVGTDLVETQIEKYRRVLEQWHKLDPISKKQFLEVLERQCKQLSDFIAEVKAKEKPMS